MTRYFVDCRETPSEMDCTVSIAADDPEELEEAAAEHMTNVHKHDDNSELRDAIRNSMHEREERSAA